MSIFKKCMISIVLFVAVLGAGIWLYCDLKADALADPSVSGPATSGTGEADNSSKEDAGSTLPPAETEGPVAPEEPSTPTLPLPPVVEDPTAKLYAAIDEEVKVLLDNFVLLDTPITTTKLQTEDGVNYSIKFGEDTPMEFVEILFADLAPTISTEGDYAATYSLNLDEFLLTLNYKLL